MQNDKKTRNVDGTVVFETTIVVEKTFNYLCDFKTLRNKLLEISKKEDATYFCKTEDYQKVPFHRTGIEKQNFVHIFNTDRLNDNYQFLKDEEKSFNSSSLLLFPLSVIKFEEKLLESLIKAYKKVYKELSELFSNNQTSLKDNFCEYDDVRESIDRLFSPDFPIPPKHFRKSQLSFRKDNYVVGMFVDKLHKFGFGAYYKIGFKLKKLQSLSKLIITLNDNKSSLTHRTFDKVYLLIGNYNVVTFYYEKFFQFSIDNRHLASTENFESKGIKEIKRIKDIVTYSIDSYSDMFEYINFNEFFELSKREVYFDKLDKNGETKRTVFVLNKYPEPLRVEGVDKNTLRTYIYNVSKFYNLLCVSICYYRSISFESLKARTEANDLFTKHHLITERMNWVNDCSCNGNVVNKAPIGEAENLFIDYSTIVYGYVTTINRLLAPDYNTHEIFYNHHIRFRAVDIYYSIVSSVIYCSMLLRVCSCLRIYLDRANSNKIPIIKNAIIKNYITIYNRSLVVYNSSSLFINHEKTEFHSILLKSLSVRDKTGDIEKSSSVAWEEANILNGYIFPFMQLLFAIASFLVVLNVCSCMVFWLRLIICAAVSLLLILIAFIPKIVAAIIIPANKLPSASKKSLHTK